MYLLDTNVASEMRKVATARVDPDYQRWVRGLSLTDAYISSVSVLEMQIGVLRKMRRDPSQGEVLRSWLHDRFLPLFSDRTIAVDSVIALRCAALHVPVTVSYTDSLIAATALVHGLVVVTRNVRDFAPMGVRVVNPWEH